MKFDFLNSILVAIISLISVIIGVGVSNLITWKLKSKESRLRTLEKIFDRRLTAHESFLAIPKIMRTTISDQILNDQGFLVTYPAVLKTKDAFEDFSFRFYEATNFNSHWYEADLRKEIFFTQDYLQNVSYHLKEIPEDKLPAFARLIKIDFRNIADTLEERILDFLLIDIHKINIKPQNRTFEYSKSIRRKKLANTELSLKWKEIKELKTN